MGQWEVMSFEKTPPRIREAEFPTASMCRLNVDTSPVEGVEQPGQVIHSRYLVGRGVKRKLSGCVDSELDLSYPQQRQLVLDLCLDKLQSCQRRPEPCLQRSVLLANTLRQIQHEMKQERDQSPSEVPAAPTLLGAAIPRHSQELPSEPSEIWSALSSSLVACENRDVEQAFFKGSTGEDEQCPSVSEEQGRTPSLMYGSFELPNSTSYLTDLQLDDIFEDIDTSMYDSTDFPSLSCLSSRGGSWTDDNLKPPPTCTSSNAMQLCFNDLQDLDHIMEILVSS